MVLACRTFWSLRSSWPLQQRILITCSNSVYSLHVSLFTCSSLLCMTTAQQTTLHTTSLLLLYNSVFSLLIILLYKSGYSLCVSFFTCSLLLCMTTAQLITLHTTSPPMNLPLKQGTSSQHTGLHAKTASTMERWELLEFVLWTYDTFDNNFWIESDFTKYLKNSCCLCSD